MLFKKCSAIILSAIMAFTSIGCVNVFAKDKTKIFIVGDSTACIYGRDDNYAVAREGWGMAFKYMLNEDNAELVNLAISGRSSKSFAIEDNYKTLLKDMKSGDYMLIQFGHNDEKADNPEEAAKDPTRVRYTSAEGDINTDGSFKNSLYKNFIVPAKEKGVNPVLLTPVSRLDFDENNECTDTHGKYDDCIRELSDELNIPCVDMTNITRELYTKEGKAQAQAYHAIYKSVEKGNYGHDNTHFNRYGALTIAELVRGELLKIDGFKDLLKPSYQYTNEFTKQYTVKRSDVAATMARILQADPVENTDTVFEDTNKLTNPEEDKTNGFLSKPDSIGYIQAAKDLGIIEGDQNGKFNPSTQISFQDLAVMVSRTIKKAGLEQANYSKSNIKDVSDYARDSVDLVNYYWKNELSVNTTGKTPIDLVSAYSMYVNLYDLIVDESETGDITVQTIDQVEKVE